MWVFPKFQGSYGVRQKARIMVIPILNMMLLWIRKILVIIYVNVPTQNLPTRQRYSNKPVQIACLNTKKITWNIKENITNLLDIIYDSKINPNSLGWLQTKLDHIMYVTCWYSDLSIPRQNHHTVINHRSHWYSTLCTIL